MKPSIQKSLLKVHPRIDKKEFILSRIERKRVLDLGCIGHTWERSETDPTWLHKSILNKSSECYGIDFLKYDVDVLNKKGYTNIFYGDATAMEIDKKFDVIVVGDLIEHVHDISGLFKTFSNHLDIDGEVVITTPNPFYINHFITILLTNQIAVNKEHVFWFDPKVITELANRFSYDVSHAEWLIDSDAVKWSQVDKQSMKGIVFFLMFKLFSFIRLLKLIRPYYSSEFGVILKKRSS